MARRAPLNRGFVGITSTPACKAQEQARGVGVWGTCQQRCVEERWIAAVTVSDTSPTNQQPAAAAIKREAAAVVWGGR